MIVIMILLRITRFLLPADDLGGVQELNSAVRECERNDVVLDHPEYDYCSVHVVIKSVVYLRAHEIAQIPKIKEGVGCLGSQQQARRPF